MRFAGPGVSSLGVAARSRRRFLGWVSLGVIAGATGVAALRATGYSLPEEVSARLKVLSPWQYIVLRAIGDRLVFPGEVNVADFADGYLVGMVEKDRTDLLKLIAVIEHGAPLSSGYIRRFSDLDARAQDEVLKGVNESSIALLRAGFEALKAIAFMAYYRLPESWPALGYPGPVAPRSLQ